MVSLNAAGDTSRWRGAWRRPEVRLVFSLTVLAILLFWLPVEQLWDTIRGVRPAVWLGCLGLLLAGHAVGSFKWGLLISLGGPRLPYGSAVRFYFAGLFANLFLPSITGGDVVRAGLAMRGSERKKIVVAGSVVDRLIDTLALVVLVMVGSALSSASLATFERRLVIAIGTAVPLVALAAAAVAVIPLPGWIPAGLHGLREKLRKALGFAAQHAGTVLFAFGVSLAIQFLFVGLAATLGRECGIDLPLAAWLFAWPLAKLLAMAPVSLGGIGVREAALAVLLGRFGVPTALAVGVGLVWDTIQISSGLFGGLFYATVRRAAPRPGAEVS